MASYARRWTRIKPRFLNDCALPRYAARTQLGTSRTQVHTSEFYGHGSRQKSYMYACSADARRQPHPQLARRTATHDGRRCTLYPRLGSLGQLHLLSLEWPWRRGTIRITSCASTQALYSAVLHPPCTLHPLSRLIPHPCAHCIAYDGQFATRQALSCHSQTMLHWNNWEQDAESPQEYS